MSGIFRSRGKRLRAYPTDHTVNKTESKGANKSAESWWERNVNLQVIKSGDSIAQDVVVSGSAFGSILPKIRKLSIACISNIYVRIIDLQNL